MTPAESGHGDAESLRSHSKVSTQLRPIDLARTAGLGVTQIRTYERLGFLPPAERQSNGYRSYTAEHVEALRVARILMTGYGWQRALEVMRAIHADDRAAAFSLVDARHADLDRQRGRITSARKAVDALMDASADTGLAGARAAIGIRSTRRSTPLPIGEAAAIAGVRPTALRFWEQQGLLQPQRHPGSGYRLYDQHQITRLRIVVLLRDVGYRFDSIREVLDDLSAGRPESVRSALEERVRALDRASASCAEATAAVHAYLTTLDNRDE